MRMYNYIKKYLNLEETSGILLIGVTIVSLIIANSPLEIAYQNFFQTHLGFQFGVVEFKKPILFWINDGLMAIFFFLVGLEIKSELVNGHLSQRSQRILPFSATLGGIIVPALIYIFINYNHSNFIKGWAIPTATDIAFALGVFTLIGKNIPQSIKVLLMSIAVLDDLSAVIIIALFYAKPISLLYLTLSSIIFMLLVSINLMKIKRIIYYLILSVLLWVFVLQSGIHATIAGIAAAFTIPTDKNSDKSQPLYIIQQHLHGWVAYLILPIFAFANAGVSLNEISFMQLKNPLVLGILLGLFLGKQIGIFTFIWIPIKLKLANLPYNTNWKHIYGISILCGIGFTMSLFIGTLTFIDGNPQYIHLMKLGVILASVSSFMYGFMFLKLSIVKKVI